MQLGFRTDQNNAWILKEKGFDSRYLGKTEANMSLGNGYMGIRSATEEHYINEKRDTFVAGTFDKFDGEVTELPNLPDVTGIDLEVDGHSLDLNRGQVKDYQRYLDLKNGLLTRSFTWTVSGKSYFFKFERFVSMDNRHLIVSRVAVTPMDDKAGLRIVSGIDGQQTNGGSQHLIEGDKRLFDGRYMQLLTKTNESNINIVFSTCHKFENFDDGSIKQQMELGRRQILCKYQQDINQNETLRFTKYTTLITDRDNDFDGKTLTELQESGLNMLKTSVKQGYDKLLSATISAWQSKVWDYGKIKIDSSDSDDQLAINFARQH